MKQNFRLGAVLFDMDGLMIDSERISQQAWERALAEQGYTLTPEAYYSVIGLTVPRALETFGKLFGPSAPLTDIYQRKQEYAETMMTRDGIGVQPGLLELLDCLDGQRLPRAVASSTARLMLDRKLAMTGLAQRFAITVAGDEVKHGKPAPDIFLAAAERLGVSPAQCVVLEDSDSGIKAAHAAGMLAVMVPDLKPPSEESRQLAYRVFGSLHEAKGFLKGLVNGGG